MVGLSQEDGVSTNINNRKLQIRTAQYQYSGPNRFDVTVKTGDRTFSPTWDMVNQYRAGILNKEEYTKQYYNLMRQSYRANKDKWLELLAQESVVLVCFCKPGMFCHRVLLAEILGKLGAKYLGEIASEVTSSRGQ